MPVSLVIYCYSLIEPIEPDQIHEAQTVNSVVVWRVQQVIASCQYLLHAHSPGSDIHGQLCRLHKARVGCGGGGVFSLIQAIKVCAAPQGGVLCRFCLESGVVFEGTTGLYERINCRFNSK